MGLWDEVERGGLKVADGVLEFVLGERTNVSSFGNFREYTLLESVFEKSRGQFIRGSLSVSYGRVIKYESFSKAFGDLWVFFQKTCFPES